MDFCKFLGNWICNFDVILFYVVMLIKNFLVEKDFFFQDFYQVFLKLYVMLIVLGFFLFLGYMYGLVFIRFILLGILCILNDLFFRVFMDGTRIRYLLKI